MMNQREISIEATLIETLTKYDLIETFGKTKNEAFYLVTKHQVMNKIIRNPILIHDSPRNWSLIILSNENDMKTLIKYYKENGE